MYVCMCVCVYVCMYVYMYVYVCIMYVCMYAYVCMYVCIHVSLQLNVTISVVPHLIRAAEKNIASLNDCSPSLHITLTTWQSCCLIKNKHSKDSKSKQFTDRYQCHGEWEGGLAG